MKNMYPHEKFSNAVNSMAVSPKSIQERVADAYVYNLIHLKPDELPEEIRYRLAELAKKLTAVEPNGNEGSVSATTNKMSMDEAVEIAQEIVTMADSVESSYRS